MIAEPSLVRVRRRSSVLIDEGASASFEADMSPFAGIAQLEVELVGGARLIRPLRTVGFHELESDRLVEQFRLRTGGGQAGPIPLRHQKIVARAVP